MTQSTNKVFAGLSSALRDNDCANHADATSEMFSTLMGKNRLIYELLTGWGPDGETAMSRKNPQGRIGIDHSGPPFGVNLRHTMWNHGSIHYLTNPTYINQGKSVELTGEPTTISAQFYCKPFPMVNGTPIGKMTYVARIYNNSVSSADVSGALSTGGTRVTLPTQTVGAGAGAIMIWNNPAQAVDILSGFNRCSIELTSTILSDVFLFASSLNSIQKIGW